MNSNKLASLKSRAVRLGFMLVQDRQTRTYALTVRGRAGTLCQASKLDAVERFLALTERKRAQEKAKNLSPEAQAELRALNVSADLYFA